MAERRRLFSVSLLALLALSSVAVGEGTRTWEQTKFEEFVKGTPHGVAIRSSGELELSPSLKTLYTSPSTYIWSVAADASGNIYAATGAPARIYRVTPDGQSSVIFEPQELQVQALLVDQSGVLYAATAPDGKVYRIEASNPSSASPVTTKENSKNVSAKNPGAQSNKTPAATPGSSWSATVYFDPGTKYIWDLAEDASGNIYVATGDHGEIYKITGKGEHSLFFKSDEVHIRVLALDPKGNLIAGSDGSGLVYRISPDGTAFVLYSAPKKEITAIAIDAAGNIYAAGAGEKRAGAGPQTVQMAAIAAAAAASPAPGAASAGSPSGGAAPAGTGAIAYPNLVSTGGSEIYRIAPDGSPTRVWTSHEDLVYALAFDQSGRLLAGTGNRGHIFAISGEDDFTDLLRVGATQVTAFAKAPKGGLYVSTSNFGKLLLLGPSTDSEGSYESDVFDAHIFSRWGRTECRRAGNVELFTRSGNVDNPDRNWSPWTKVDFARDAESAVPAARFTQWKAVLHSGTPAPRVESVLLHYLPKNVPPDVDEVNVTVGVRYPWAVRPVSESGGQPRYDTPTSTIQNRDSIGVRWAAHDDNDDQMVYSVYYRGDSQSRWLLLRDDLIDKFYSFDASLLPDGGYTVKVVASDAPSHSPSDALTAEKESSRFEVDSTPPSVAALAAAVENNQIHVNFRAADGFSTIKRAEYSIDAGDWRFVEPLGQISDSRSENYDFRVPILGGPDAANAASREHVIVVRVYDRYDNMSSAKTIIPGK